MTIKNFIADLGQIYFNLKLNLKNFIKTQIFMTKKYLKQKILLLVINQVLTCYHQ
jgi:hypothetical protein